MRKLLLFGLVAALGVLGISAVALASRSHDKGNAKDFSAKLNGWEEDPSQVTTGRAPSELTSTARRRSASR